MNQIDIKLKKYIEYSVKSNLKGQNVRLIIMFKFQFIRMYF